MPRVFQVVAQTVKEAGITLPIEQRPSDGYRDWRVEDKEKTSKHKFAYGPAGVRNPGVSLYRMRPDNNESGYWSGPACDEYMRLYARGVAERDPRAAPAHLPQDAADPARRRAGDPSRRAARTC